MILGYIISGDDNDTYMFNSNDSEIPVCKKCGYIINFEYISLLYKLKRKKYDISSTYDNRIIVSDKFKDFLLRNNYSGLLFNELPNDSGYFSFFVKNVLPFDTEKRTLKYDKYCTECKHYESVSLALPLVIKNLNRPLKDGIFCTDIKFGSGNEKSPIIFIGLDTYKKMKKEKFKGIHFLKFDTELSVPWK